VSIAPIAILVVLAALARLGLFERHS